MFIKIIIVTISLSIGINVLNMEQVIFWKFLITKYFKNQWQRLGCGGQGYSQISKGYIFLPYWAFDIKNINRPEIE